MFLLLSSQTQRGSLGIWIRASLLAISYLADEQRFSASRSVVVWTLVIHFAPSSHPHIVRKLFWFKTIWCTRDATLITNPPLSKWISPPWNNRNTNTTFNLSQTKWSSQYPKITPSTSLLVITWTSKYLTLLELLSENLWPCAGFFFFFFCCQWSAPGPAHSTGTVLWSTRLLSLTAPGHGWSCNISLLSRGCTAASPNSDITYSQTAAS